MILPWEGWVVFCNRRNNRGTKECLRVNFTKEDILKGKYGDIPARFKSPNLFFNFYIYLSNKVKGFVKKKELTMTWDWNDINGWDDFDLQELLEGDLQDFLGDENLPTPVTGVKPKGKYKDGMLCATCKEYVQYAEPNQKDGSYVCFKCRKP
jgi:hypothetical protein